MRLQRQCCYPAVVLFPWYDLAPTFDFDRLIDKQLMRAHKFLEDYICIFTRFYSMIQLISTGLLDGGVPFFSCFSDFEITF